MDVTGQDAPPRDGEWGAPTHYSGQRSVESPAGRHAVLPPEVDGPEHLPAGAGPTPEDSNQILAATLIAELTGTLAGDAGAPWGATTYIGPGGHRAPDRVRPQAAVPTGAAGTPVTGRTHSSGEPAAAQRSERGLFANTRAIALASLASRVTGFLRSVLLVAALGAGGVSIAYNSGNNLPNMIYELLLGGVLSSVLIPLLVQAETEDSDGGLAYTQRLLSIATAALAVLTALAVAAAPWIAAAFVQPGHQRDLTATFAALLLPEIFFYGLGAMFMAVLNIKHIYGPGAWAPLLNNLVVIATVLVFWVMPGPKTLDPGTITTAQVLVVGIGTTLGIAAQALVLIPSLRRTGFRWAWRFRAGPGGDERLRQLGNLGAWVLGYVVVSQIGVSVIQRIGNDNGGFTVFTTADLLFQMPYGILVVSVLTAIMPRLSRAAVRDDRAAVIGDLALGARLSAVALVPVTVGLLVLGTPLGITLFAHGQADVLHARLIGSSLAWSAFGLFPFALVMLQLRVFYAMRDGRTPTIVNIAMVATKVILVLVSNVAFRPPAGTDVLTHPSAAAVQWLAISTSLSYVVGAVVGHVLLARRLGHLGFAAVARTVLRIGVASVVGGAAAWAVAFTARHQFDGTRVAAAVGLVGGGLVGAAVLIVVVWRARIPDIRELVALTRQ